MKDWSIVIIILLIIAVVLDGIRRMRQSRRERIELSKNAQKADREGTVAVSTSEFPSGGARVAARRDEEDVSQLNQAVRRNFESGRVTRGLSKRIPEQVSLNLSEPVPMLMDSVEQAQGDKAEQEDEVEDFADPREPQLGSLQNLSDDEPDASDKQQENNQQEKNGEPAQPAPKEPAGKGGGSAQRRSEIDNAAREPEQVLIINVMAKAGERFAGPALLSALMGAEMKFGEMDIFHRHQQPDGDGPILFSLANMVVPGTFNLAAMEEFETPGVSLFLSLPVAGESLAAYNDMAATAKALAQTLGGELKDENRSVMTQQTIEHGRQRVIEYERKRKLARA